MSETNVMYFTPYAWAKMLFLRDKSKDEVSGFGVTPRHLNLIEDIAVPKQEVQSAYVDIDDTGLAIMCDEMAQKGLQPAEFMRIWIHTHPAGCGATPSGRDEQCMRDSFSTPDWACMMILSQNGQASCRLQVNKPFKITKDMEIKTHFGYSFPASNIELWEKEYDEKVKKKSYVTQGQYLGQQRSPVGAGFYAAFDEKELLGFTPGKNQNYAGNEGSIAQEANRIAIAAGYSAIVAEHVAFIAAYFFGKTALQYGHIVQGIKACIEPKEQSKELIQKAIVAVPDHQRKALATCMAHTLNVILPTAGITMSDIFMIAGEGADELTGKAKKREDKKKEKNLHLQHQQMEQEEMGMNLGWGQYVNGY